MPLLFFALASASSEQTSHEACTSLALHPGSNGWQSARCCIYPQELLLQLERGAEVHEVEISAKGDLVPKSVEVHLSQDSSGDPAFQHVCTLELRATPSPSSSARIKRAKEKMFALCSGQVKLIIHEPLIAGPSNPYKQVSLASVDIWGHEDALPRKPSRGPLDLGEQHDEIATVLMELGVPLSLVPVDEDSSRLVTSDLGTKNLVKELREKEEDLLQMQKFGEAQQLEEHVQQLYLIGQELHELHRSKDDAIKERPRNLAEIERLSQRVSGLEAKRLHLAALYDTKWWLSAMSLAPNPEKLQSSMASEASPSSSVPSERPLGDSVPSMGSAPRAPLPLVPGFDSSPKSARNSMPDFGRGERSFGADALATARSQP